MAATLSHPVPRALEQRLAALVPRVRALRVTRGASLCLLTAVGSTTLVLLLDALVGLPATARGLLIAVWVTALGVLVWQFVVKPWRAEIPLSDVAVELSQRLPELAERLNAVVNPADGTSGAVRAALAEDALRRAKVVDFARAIPTHPALLRASGALLALLAFLVLTGLVPGSADRLRRVALPWVRPPAAAVRVVVTSGEPVVKRGGTVTLTAFAERTDSRPGAPRPDRATALLRSGPGEHEEPAAMTADDTGVFHVTRANVARDFEYCVQIGGATSEWFRVAALDPVELAPGARFDLAAPDYANRPRRPLPQFADFEAREFSQLTAQLKFTQPAASAHFEWRGSGDGKPDTFPIELAPDRLSGAASVLLRSSGELRLVLVREVDGKRLRTVLAANAHVVPDKGPWFEHVSGASPRPRTVRPGARVAVTIVACDDASVTAAVLEYTLDTLDSRIESVPISLMGAGSPRATGRVDLDPAAIAPAGGSIRFRVRVTDNRSVDDPKLTPQESLYPPTGWSELTASATAPPLEEQDIEHQRDAFRDAAQTARALVRDATDAVTAVRASPTDRGPLTVDQAVRVNAARGATRRASAALTGLARDPGLAPELRPLATAARSLAEGELRTVADALAHAEADGAGRADSLTTAVTSLTAAGAKIDALVVQNAELARARLDRARLGALADEQAALATAAENAPNEFPERQRALIARLKAIVEGSEPLKLASEGASGEEARRLARDIAALSDALRELDEASSRTVTDARAALVADVAREQDALARRATQVFGALGTAARLAGVSPPHPDDFRRITDLAAAGKTVDALTELEKLGRSLEHIASEFETWATERADPKKGAKHLALWQGDLLARLRAATQAVAFDKLSAELRTAFRTEQTAIRAALGRLHLPPDATAKTARDDAFLHLSKARDFLAADGQGADLAMRLAAEALNRLADATPLLGERLNRALREFDRIRQDQEALATAVEQALRGPEGQPAVASAVAKRLAALADRQRKLAPAVAALDAPGFGGRQTQIAAAIARAGADLRDGSPLDVQASQLLVRRAVERLKLALEGTPPVDVKAEELARKIGALADALDAHGPGLTAKSLEPAVPTVQEALRQLPAVAPEAATLLNDARSALQAAEAGFRDDSKPDECRRRVRAAGDALGKLSARLNGSETDLECVQRLAMKRRDATARAKELADAKAPFSAPASDEALRQLAREFEELAHTRVGAAGQVQKRRVLDQYARLRARPEPDRLVSDQRAVAETLDELAAKMADVAELATVPLPEPPAPPAEADAYVPSRALADQLRELVLQQRTLHDRLTNFPRALADRLRPATVNVFAALEVRQRAIGAELLALAPEAEAAGRAACAAADRLRAGSAAGAKAEAETALALARALARVGEDKPWGTRAAELSARQGARLADIIKLTAASNAAALQQLARAGELAGRAVTLADTLDRAARGRSPQDATRGPLLGAAGAVRESSKRLLAAGQKAAEADTLNAPKLRAEAIERVRAAHARASEAIPAVPATNPELGDALRTAERAMRSALRAPNPAANEATAALRSAAASVTTPN